MRVVWEQHRAGILLAKVALIERAVAAVGSAQFDDQLRDDAQRAAHMLCGSLGMFGFTRASEAARELEREFARATRARTPTLLKQLAIVRRGLGAWAHSSCQAAVWTAASSLSRSVSAHCRATMAFSRWQRSETSRSASASSGI
jgi:HPt (histidine-containing phosphotransfer) domain-containing protein